VTPTHAGESCRGSIRWYRGACRSLLRGRPEGLPRYRLRTPQAMSETATRVSSRESTYAAVCRGYKPVNIALFARLGAWVARCRCRCRSPAPTCRSRPGAHCCVFATSRGTVANPAATAVGRDRHLQRPGSDWRGLIRATNSHTEARGLSCVPKHTGSGLDRAPVPVARFGAFTASVPFDLTTPREMCSCRVRPCRQHSVRAR
jgi:hypothetical protein